MLLHLTAAATSTPYLWVMGIIVSPEVIAGKGASTVSTPSLLKDERMVSGLTPFGNKNSRLYSL